MFNLAGRFSILLIIAAFFGSHAMAAEDYHLGVVKWDDFAKQIRLQKESDARRGLSYVISGSLALVGGIAGANLTDDNVEKGIYTIFQTIGIASIGYGAYVAKIGSEERTLFETLNNIRMPPEQKTLVLRSYYYQTHERERKERLIKAVTHALIASLNFYSASQQKQATIRSGLYFIGGVNLLAAVSFSVEF
jgi:hypothetical protein